MRAKNLFFFYLLFIIMLTSTFFINDAQDKQIEKRKVERRIKSITLSDSYVVSNSFVKFESDSGYDGQGPYTIVNGFNLLHPSFKDFIWYGEYEYVSLDGGSTWTQLSTANGITRNIVENEPGKDYTIIFSSVSGVNVQKRVSIMHNPDKPLAKITYTISSSTPKHVKFYYSIDYCDYESSGDPRDDVYTFSGTHVETAGWLNGINGLILDTQGSGYGILMTWPSVSSFYAGYWYDALYAWWGTGYTITNEDTGIGVMLDFGVVGQSQVSKDLYIGLTTGPWESPPAFPNFPLTATFYYEPTSPQVGQVVIFNATPSISPNTNIIRYFWDFGDFTNTTESDPVTTHVYTYPSVYWVTLIITNSNNVNDTAIKQINISTIPTYDVTIKAYCNVEQTNINVGITMDGSPTGHTTPHTFTELTGTHTFTVPENDANGHQFRQWNTGETSTTITVKTGGTYTAYYDTKYTLTITASQGGSTNPTPGTYTYWAGTEVTITAIPQEGYVFDHWELNNENIGSQNPLSITMHANYNLYAAFIPSLIHDIALTNITFSNIYPKVNETIEISVTVENRGTLTETFDVYVNYTRVFDPLIGKQTIILPPGQLITLNFTWIPNATGRYEIKAYTSPILEDVNPQDNTRIVYIYVIAYTSASSTDQNEWENTNARNGRLRYMAYTL